jgi:sugar lactone lactonase YvrE
MSSPDKIDGLRTDVSGRLLIAGIRKSSVAVMTPDGNVLQELSLKNKEPMNLVFGGIDGRTVSM